KHKYADFPVNTTWNKQAYIRYQAKKRIAIEIGAEHYQFKNKHIDLHNPEHADWTEITGTTTSSYIPVYLSFQYDLMGRTLHNKTGCHKNLRSYIGIMFAPVFLTEKSDDKIRNLVTGTITYSERYYKTTLLTAGFNHTLNYKLTKSLTVFSVISYRLDLSDAFASGWSLPIPYENQLSFQIGGGYTF